MRTIEDEIKQKAKSSGFDLVGITTAEPIDSAHLKHFKKWLAAGRNGKMAWLAKNIEKRFNPALLLPNAQSVICTALNYKSLTPSGKIASYALYQDYHNFIKQRLFELADFLKNQILKNLKFKICVDSAPLAERAIAERAGLGFIGKNHLLTNPQLGSFLLLGELITNLPLEPDNPLPSKDYCKDCSRCIDACPGGAISKNRFFDACKCISYLTIEHKGRIPKELKSKINSHLFGCDRCILACPYNKKAPACGNRDFKFFAERLNLLPEQILKFSQDDFNNLFADSPINRTGLRQLKRNALICAKNQNKI
ncbi:MAG: tRNA epoxyqueuosine(34) reductase QueG [Phycisphaerae bacterium]|nr:tRNA epoxyqueuosine(34) reductase QueG [Phycisphaerae bacterium]